MEIIGDREAGENEQKGKNYEDGDLTSSFNLNLVRQGVNLSH